MLLEKLNSKNFETLTPQKLHLVTGGGMTGKGSIVIKTETKREIFYDGDGKPWDITLYKDHYMSFNSDDTEGCYYGVGYYEGGWELR
ncbi:MAG: hypothetical protein BGO31_07275 [Bacteroidetes bacterium 43-16]|nr:MAG: hypothetical protein BGO31_07275 [Bacteroidetes bacterium 43-16]